MSKTKEEKIETFTELTKRINEILNDESLHPLEKGINTREYETKVTTLARDIKFNNELIDRVESKLQQSNGNYFDFTLFYVFFTWKRRNNYNSLKAFYNSYKDKFSKYKILVHIKGMAILAESNQPKILKETIDDIDEFINQPNSQFSDHVGILNLYVELVCSYCELKFDERNSDEINYLLERAFNHITNIINIEESKIEKGNKPYEKFYLNKGRILIMLKQYEAGEQEILKAISLIPLSQDRAIIVNKYSQYLAKSPMIKVYDLTEKKLKELGDYQDEMHKNLDKINDNMRKKLDRQKVDSYKIITLIMAVIGFLLGSISIFTKVENTFTLLMVMLAYSGLMLFLVGIVLITFHFYLKNENKQYETEQQPDKHEKISLRIAISILITGVLLFVIPLTLTLLKMFNRI